jgi:hypothetical protein
MTTPYSHTPSTRVIAVTPDLIDLAGDGNAAIFLAQVLFWWRVAGRKKFYKFNAPCDHKSYRTGDSWLEELRFKRTMFATARRRVAVKVRISCLEEVQSALNEGALIVYATDENHLTWYMVNEQALQQRSPAVFGRFFESAAAVTPTPVKTSSPSQHHIRSASKTTSQSVGAATPNHVSTQGIPAPLADAQPPHPLMQDPCIGIHTENTSEIAPETASKSSLLATSLALIPLPTSEGGGVKDMAGQEVISEIFKGLQERGVQDDPARLIARRAVRVELGAPETLEMFDAHLLDAERANAISPVGVAVARMVKNSQITPAPAWALARVRQRNQERVWQAQQEQTKAEKPAGSDEAIDITQGEAGAAPLSSLNSLWQQVLNDIKLQVTRATFEQRFQHTWLEQGDNGYIVRAQDAHTLEWLAHRLNHMVTNTLRRYVGMEIGVGFI